MGRDRLAAGRETAFRAELTRVAQDTERLLESLLPDLAGDRLNSAMRYAVLGGGKRLRPFLVAQSTALFDVAPERGLRTGAAIECLHCYSLVHDDLPSMDNDDLRRGRPTVHKQYDEATAILAGDALLTFAFEILSSQETHPAADIRALLVQELARAAGALGMVGGQMQDLIAQSQPLPAHAEIRVMQFRKTGALLRYAAEAGAILGGAERTALQAYGTALGLAFQIADDVLDVESDPLQSGKATQKDKSRGKATFVELMGLDGAKREARALAEKAIEALAIYGSKADMLRETAAFVISRRS